MEIHADRSNRFHQIDKPSDAFFILDMVVIPPPVPPVPENTAPPSVSPRDVHAHLKQIIQIIHPIADRQHHSRFGPNSILRRHETASVPRQLVFLARRIALFATPIHIHRVVVPTASAPTFAPGAIKECGFVQPVEAAIPVAAVGFLFLLTGPPYREAWAGEGTRGGVGFVGGLGAAGVAPY